MGDRIMGIILLVVGLMLLFSAGMLRSRWARKSPKR